MALMPDPKSGVLALTRFGYGPHGDGDSLAAAADPRGFLKAELAQPGIALLSGAGMPATPLALQALFADQARKRAEKERLEKEAAEKATTANNNPQATKMAETRTGTGETMQPAMTQPAMTQPVMNQPNMNQSGATSPKPAPPAPEQVIFRTEVLARMRRAIEARSGLVERLVAFWSNHFCISVQKSSFGRATAGAFEREAIRPFVLGRFADMLKAVESHPAMLHYLDNAQSIGPNSKAGQNGKRGLNENLAREIMELHTLGVRGGYSQTDVTSLARILTGWTSVGADGRDGEPGAFIFRANAHEPGVHALLGKTYPDIGRGQGDAALDDLASHPATANFVVGKFVQHFIADTPPAGLVDMLVRIFRATDGDLKALTTALIESDAAWTTPATKMRSPYEFLIAVNRALGHVPDDPGQVLGALNTMGMPFWAPPGPNGYSDLAATWAAPEGLKMRLDLAADITSKVKDPPNPSELLDALYGPAASAETRQAIARAESKPQGLALLFMSPEFQRR
jgi:uncharacterized protein (DUF1800 family)